MQETVREENVKMPQKYIDELEYLSMCLDDVVAQCNYIMNNFVYSDEDIYEGIVIPDIVLQQEREYAKSFGAYVGMIIYNNRMA